MLDEIDTALNFAKTMTWKGKHPVVELLTQTYETGVKLTAKEMQALEAQIERLPGLEKWFVNIPWYCGSSLGCLIFCNSLTPGKRKELDKVGENDR